MTLIKSISGLRGTIGGKPKDNLTPLDIVKFSMGFGAWIKEFHHSPKMIIGRDARPSGKSFAQLVANTLINLGIEIVDLELTTTPTLSMAILEEKAQGGIILTASHNPDNWNALKLFNHKGEFISAEDGKKVLEKAKSSNIEFVTTSQLGAYHVNTQYINYHIQKVLEYKWVNVQAIKNSKIKVIVDAVNSTGGISIPPLLKKMGVEVNEMYCTPNGKFPHNPEPLPEHLKEMSNKLANGKYDMGIVVDPDVDRLVLMCEDGTPFGEEYTLVAVADYMLSKKKGNTVSNLSSTRALSDITQSYGTHHYASAVGEVHVVEKMKKVNAVIGGEGNGGVIVPALHYGRDALIGIALFLSYFVEKQQKMTTIRASYPQYFISKKKIQLDQSIVINKIIKKIQEEYKNYPINTIDGLKIEMQEGWVQLRKSNTEPIIRIFAESKNKESAEKLTNQFIKKIKELS